MKNLFAKFQDEFWQRPGVRLGLLVVIFIITMLGILLADFAPERVQLQVGQVSRRDIRAPRQVVNRYQTNILKEEAAKQAVKEATGNPANYDINQAVAVDAEEALDTLFEWAAVLRTGRLPILSDGQVPPEEQDASKRSEGEQTEGFPSPPSSESSVANLTVGDRAAWLQIEASRWLNISISDSTAVRLLVTGTVNFSALRKAAKSAATKVLRERRISPEHIEEARAAAMAGIEGAGLTQADKAAAADLAAGVIVPNLVLNPDKIERARQQAANSVAPILVQRGEIVVRNGEQVTQEDIQILEDLGLKARHPNYFAVVGLILFVLIWVLLLGIYLWQFSREMLESEGLLALLGLIIVIITFTAKVLSLIPWEGAGYLIPVSFGTMLVSLLLDSRLAIMVAVLFSVVVGIVTDGGAFSGVALIGGITAVYGVSRVSLRSDVTRAGFLVGATNFVAMFSLGLLNGESFLLRNSYLGLLNGVVSSVATIGFLPYLESIFGITSSLRLLELSNPNQPLLRRLLMDAPGTYHHSIIVGNLAEAAAEAVGADGLLARVGAHYHDIGKLRRPYFFIENQITSDNPHEKIAPSLSTLIITSHVKDGVELAKQYKLPSALIDFIQQHHGSDLVKYFFRRATESGKEETVEEKDFRYPGPKPQSKETAIVMLADSVEAAVRSLSKPTPGRIEGLVRKIIKGRLNDGQLDESDLTLRDLDQIAEAFTRILTGIFHNRVEYPEEVSNEEITGEEGEPDA